MPTYEYVCTKCGHHVEAVQSMTDEPLKTCGVCGGELRKVFHAAGVVFKGSGFYSTDSRAKQKSSSGSSKKDGSKGETKSSAEKSSSADPSSKDPSSGASKSSSPSAERSSTGSSSSAGSNPDSSKEKKE